MKLTSIAAVIGFIVLSSSTLASDRLMDGPADTDSIRVGSYNIMASRMGSTDAIVEAIRKMNVDIIGLQEVDNMTGRSGKNHGSLAAAN
ncbi:TPA: hypothetical protein ACH7QX_005315 [Escherichia coli]